jgi:beta-galactosidase/beta-glucuronidase
LSADITEHVRAGQQARVTVLVNNTLTFQSIPPGVIEDTPTGPRQRYWHDFFNYAGIHRPVWLYHTGPVHLTDITVVTGIDGTTGIVEYAKWLNETNVQAARSAAACGLCGRFRGGPRRQRSVTGLAHESSPQPVLPWHESGL